VVGSADAVEPVPVDEADGEVSVPAGVDRSDGVAGAEGLVVEPGLDVDDTTAVEPAGTKVPSSCHVPVKLLNGPPTIWLAHASLKAPVDGL
jgi:hypothetical protein